MQDSDHNHPRVDPTSKPDFEPGYFYSLRQNYSLLFSETDEFVAQSQKRSLITEPNRDTILNLPQIQKIRVESTFIQSNNVDIGSETSYLLTFTGLNMNTIIDFAYSLNCTGFTEYPILTVIDDFTAQATLKMVTISTSETR